MNCYNSQSLNRAMLSPSEKAEQFGIEYLTDTELLAIVLKNGAGDKYAYELASSVLAYHKGNLSNLRTMSLQEIMCLDGIGRARSILLKAISELAVRLIQEERRDRISLSNSYSVAMYFMEIMRYCPTEKILAVYFNCKNELLGYEEISKGTKNEVLLDPALVFKIGFNFNAYSLVLVHNHPSGDPSPSVADYNMTKRLKECGAMLGIDVKDHIIIGDNVYYSFFERNVLKA